VSILLPYFSAFIRRILRLDGTQTSLNLAIKPGRSRPFTVTRCFVESGGVFVTVLE
jgi:hypothetical protein